MAKSFAVVGSDARTLAAGDWLRRQGYEVMGTEQLYRADVLLLPMPLDAEKVGLAQLLRAAKPGAVALGGRVSPAAMEAAGAAMVPLLDYFNREDLARLNAIPTAEGCILLLLQNRRRTLWQSRVAVLGYGRIGEALARRLLALGARPLVAARGAAQRAQALSDGCEVCPLQQLEQALNDCDVAVNTIPAPVLGRDALGTLPPASLIVDLASEPGGVDKAAAQALGHTCLHALSLPARVAPITAGELVGRAVLALLQERGDL